MNPRAMGTLPTFPEPARLRTYPACESDVSEEVHLRLEGISSLCPITGQPDTATILITYHPGETGVDEDSVWDYLCTFRNFPAFNEEIVNRILDDLVTVAQPVGMTITGRFAPLGVSRSPPKPDSRISRKFPFSARPE